MKKALVLGIIIAFIALAWLSPKYFAANKRKITSEETNASSDSNSVPTTNSSIPDFSNSSPSPIAQPVLSKPKQDFMDRFPGEWKFHETPSGEIRSLMGGTIPKVAATPESALNFLREIAPLLGTRAENLQLRMFQPKESPRGVSYSVEQVIDGYKVYQGEATLVGNKKTGDGFIVNSTIRSISYDGSRPQFTALQAEEAILEMYRLEPGDANLMNPDPMLFEVRQGRSELAWVFSADLKGQPSGSHEVVVSAISGKVIYTEARNAN